MQPVSVKSRRAPRHGRARALQFAAALAAVMANGLHAQEASSWQWRGTVYGWLSSMEMDTRFPSGAGGPTIEVDAETLVDNLDFAFMAALQGRYGRWGFFTDIIYLNEGAGGTLDREVMVGDLPLPAEVRLDADLDLKSWVWTVAPTYSLSSSDRSETDVFLGARMLDIDTELGWTFTGDIGPLQLPSRSGINESSATNWDAVMGIKGHASMGANGRWILPWYVDIGTGDSDFTWQALAGIGYRFGWGAMLLTWRHLDYNLESGAAVTNLVLSGPMVGASFRW